MKLVRCRTRKRGTDRSKLGRITSQKSRAFRRKGTPVGKRQANILVRPLSKWWEFYVVHRNVLEGL